MHPHTIFLIDDDSDDQEIFHHALEKANGETTCVFADDGIQALEKLKTDLEFKPDFIFIDMNMPRMNGQQCLAEIKKIERLQHVPVYMYSTSVNPESLEENKRLGAEDFIVKPSNIHELVEILRNILQRPVFAVMLLLMSVFALPQTGFAQEALIPVKELKKMSVEELMSIVVTSVSRTPENLSEVASAIQVVTGYDIERSAAKRLPEALRLAPNLQVAQSGSHDWGISARGFNGSPVASSSLANKLLVMIDGRTVYTPLFGGVFWDVQNVMLEDVDLIEVVSGPGGTLWGSNAVNGVINVISKTSKETQGLYASASFGTLAKHHLAARFGGQIDSTLFFRVYGQSFDYDNTSTLNGTDANDEWKLGSGGMRLDYIPSDKQTFTLQGEFYGGEEDPLLPTFVNGQHLLAKWVRNQSNSSSTLVQTYFDRTWREIRNNPFTDELITFDVDIQQKFALGRNHIFVLGVGYRLQDDDTKSLDNRFTPDDKLMPMYSGFIQDQITLKPDKLTLTVGTKILHNIYTDFEIQPSIRLAWTPDTKNTLWAAVSRAVRTPSRFDIELTNFNMVDHPEFISEEVIAYELGYRLRPLQKLSFSIATFYNQYDNLRSINASETPGLLYFANDLAANTWGVEISGNVLVSDWWRLRGGATYLNKEFRYMTSSVLNQTELFEAIDPDAQLIVQSVMDIGESFELDIVGRYIGELPDFTGGEGGIDPYVNLNVRLAWEYKFLTFSINGQNLLNPYQSEFGARQIPRSAHGNITIRL